MKKMETTSIGQRGDNLNSHVMSQLKIGSKAGGILDEENKR